MCTSHKKDVLRPTALSQCHLVPTLEFTWPTNCEFSAKLGVQLDEFYEFTVRPHKCQCLQKGGGGRKPVLRFKVRWRNGLHKEALLRKRVASNAAEVYLWGSKV